MMTLDMHSNFEEAHAAVWELLPWYVNGTLDDNEQNLVKIHLLSCRRCHKELDRCQTALSAVHWDREEHWQEKPDQLSRLFDQIDALEGGQKNDSSKSSSRFLLNFSSLANWLDARVHLPRWGLAVPAALVLMVATMMFHKVEAPQEAQFETLTSAPGESTGAAADETRLQLIFSPDSTNAQIVSLLQSLNADARIVNGPTDKGRFTVAIAAQSPTDLKTMVDELMAMPEVMFAQPEY